MNSSLDINNVITITFLLPIPNPTKQRPTNPPYEQAESDTV